MRYDQSGQDRRYDGTYGGHGPAGAGYGRNDFYDRSPNWQARAPGSYGAMRRSGRESTWFGGYGGQIEEDAYMRHYRDSRPGERDGRVRRHSYEAEYGPRYRPNPGRQYAVSYGGYGGFYREWGPGDIEGRRLSRGDGF